MPDLTSIDANRLATEGFTQPGVDQFRKVIQSYGDELLRRTTLKAAADKTDSSTPTREVTSTHVRQAAIDIAANPATKPVSRWSIMGQVLEYLLTAGSGVGAGHLDKQSGIITFAVCLVLATLLVVTRLSKGRS